MSLVDLGKRLLESSKLGETEEVRTLMTNGAPFTTDWLGTSPLHMAAQYGHLATAEVLLRAGISRDAKTKVDRTPLHLAAQEGHLDIVELLVKHGAEVDAKDMLKMTPLHWAVERGHTQVVTTLLNNQADVKSLSKFDKTPIDIAEDNCNAEMAQLLMQYLSKGKQHSTKKYPGHSTKPFVIKAESLSSSQSRSKSNNVTLSGIKGSQLLNPVFLANIQKAAAASSSKVTSSDSEEGETTEQSSTNVLATLAALAEATAPNATISTAEALHWLEMNGITMLPTDDSTVVGSALEGGQTVALTEAGKLALTWVKEHQNLNSSHVSSTQNPQSSTMPGTSTSAPKLLTIVADQSHMPSIISSSSQTPIVVLSSPSVSTTVCNSSPPMKKFKSYTMKKPTLKVSSNGISDSNLNNEDEKLNLKKELEKMRKEAEQYKARLVLKEHEAELYRKELERIRTVPKVNQ